MQSYDMDDVNTKYRVWKVKCCYDMVLVMAVRRDCKCEVGVKDKVSSSS